MSVNAIQILEKAVVEHSPAIERWFRMAWQDYTPPFFCAVHLNHAPFKLIPEKANLFPDGFHFLSSHVRPLVVQALMAAMDKYCPQAKNVLLIPQNKISDANYLQNIAYLSHVLGMIGVNVALGALTQDKNFQEKISLPNGETLVLEAVRRIHSNRRVGTKNFNPCTILLNNPLDKEDANVLTKVYEQVLFPPLHATSPFHQEKHYQQAYMHVTRQLAKLIGVDEWLIQPYCDVLEGDLSQPKTKELFLDKTDRLLTRIRRRYKRYNVNEKPMIWVGQRTNQIASLKDARNWLENQGKVSTVMQEVVSSFDMSFNFSAQPIVYLIDRYVIGGYCQYENKEGDVKRTPFENVIPLPNQFKTAEGQAANKQYLLGVLSRLAILASSIELEKTDPELID